MKLNNVQYLRYLHLQELGVNFFKLAECFDLSVEDTIVFLTEWYQYNKILEIKKINVVLTSVSE